MRRTRQDHIDRQVMAVQRCGAHRGNFVEYVVMFTNGEWACSSGHVSNNAKLPCLRTPDLDPVEWIRAHAEEMVRAGFLIAPCVVHKDGDQEAESWGQEGHLWHQSHHRILTLCLPRESKPTGAFQGW